MNKYVVEVGSFVANGLFVASVVCFVCFVVSFSIDHAMAASFAAAGGAIGIGCIAIITAVCITSHFKVAPLSPLISRVHHVTPLR